MLGGEKDGAMSNETYGQFCPVAMAAETLGRRWTLIILRELLAGSTRFNELRRGAPRMSPALLSQRLKELEEAGVVDRLTAPGDPRQTEYRLTAAGRDLWPVVEAVGIWGQRWVASELSLQKLDVDLLMWDMRRNLDPRPLPPTRKVVQFVFTDVPAAKRSFWLLIDPDAGADLCKVDMGFDVDLYASVDLRTMTAIWMGLETVRGALAAERLRLTGERELAASMQTWLGLSPFAKERKLAS
jgi:DNA-binding HxlR family transcriptional regulator